MDENGSESSAPARIEQRLPGWIPVVLVVAMALGLTKQLYGWSCSSSREPALATAA